MVCVGVCTAWRVLVCALRGVLVCALCGVCWCVHYVVCVGVCTMWCVLVCALRGDQLNLHLITTQCTKHTGHINIVTNVNF